MNRVFAQEESIVNIDDLISNAFPEEFRFASDSSLGFIISTLLPYIYALTGIFLLVFLILGGFNYLTSAGDPKKVESAKGRVTAAIIGFVLVFTAYWITQIVNYIFGLEAPF